MSGSYIRRLSSGVLPPDGLKWTVASRTVRGEGAVVSAQRHVAPAHLAAPGPAQVQLDDRLGRPRWGPVGVGDLGPARAVVPPRRGELRLGHRGRPPQVAADRRLIERDVPALRVPPVDLGHDAAPGEVHALRLVARVEPVMAAPGDGEGLRPVAVHAVAPPGPDDEHRMTARPIAGLAGELGADLVAGRAGRPARRCPEPRPPRLAGPPRQGTRPREPSRTCNQEVGRVSSISSHTPLRNRSSSVGVRPPRRSYFINRSNPTRERRWTIWPPRRASAALPRTFSNVITALFGSPSRFCAGRGSDASRDVLARPV